MSRFASASAIVLVLMFTGCTKEARERLSEAASKADAGGSGAKGNEFDFMNIDEETTKEEIALMHTVKDFYVAIADREYEKAFGMLSPYALTNVSSDQFVDESDEAKGKNVEPERFEKLTKEQFLAGIKKLEQRFGNPAHVNSLWVEETDPKVLAGEGDRISVLFSIGMMPASTPAELRKAAMRGEIGCKLRPEQLKEIAEQYQMTVEELEKDDDFNPHFSLKTVLLDEGGSLKIGYFEFVPPNIFD